ncbi:putative nucleotidyltransferase substrate binding domain-containing protein [Candidatus Magnetaquicoccus inordinatus]|uniref:putative nucleotidyltransferase substrate binding domain-containing protein n=1 Tax=Candidatus Magnetaquicoccus inordinatus TaxID=2496818 RepID=UPI00102B0015|nr:putative nucleotidyltransferase substrate binding domain-containing protein [Candidatus Magnetaquicoccus inordinatus]
MTKIREWDYEGSVTSILTSRIRDLNLTKPVILDDVTTIREAAQQMRARRIDSVLVSREGAHGIVTSADIRDALALSALSVDTPIYEIASWNLVTASSDELLFKALLLMTKRGVNRLVVGTSENVIATLGLTELLSYLTNHASLSIQRIHQATSVEELAEAVLHQSHWVNSLFSKGMQVRYIGRLVRELDRHIYVKLARLISTPEVLEHLCVLVLGSEGRGEQIVKTDQDNALIVDEMLPAVEMEHFRHAFTAALLQLGYPPCPGNVMMSNPIWGCGVRAFQTRLSGWIENPTPDNLMHLAICYDARAVAGDAKLFRAIRDYLMASLPADPVFYAHFAMPVLNFKTPIGIFKRFIVEKGTKQGQIDLKRGGIFPIVHGARSLALEQRLRDPNTIRRIRGLIRKGVLEESLGNDLIDAFDFMYGLRIRSRLRNQEQGKAGNDHLLLSSLGRLDREKLRDCFEIVDRFKQLLTHHFRLRSLQ